MTTTITILNHGSHPVVVSFRNAQGTPTMFSEVLIPAGKFSHQLVLHDNQTIDVREATPVVGVSEVLLPSAR